jgi:hypothetical protein
VPHRLHRFPEQPSPAPRIEHQTTAEQGASRPCICETATGFSPQPLISRNRNRLSRANPCYSCCGSTESRRRLDRGTADGRTSSGCHSAMVRTHSRAHATLPTPGNSRRNSTTAESSPRCSKAVRIMAACASLTENIVGAWSANPYRASGNACQILSDAWISISQLESHCGRLIG